MRVKDDKIPRGNGLIELGCIRVGEMTESKNGKPHPVSLDYFKGTGKNGPMFHRSYGEKPTQIRIMFFSDDDDFVCNEILEYRGATLYADGDGENFRVWNKQKNEYEKFNVDEYREKYKSELLDDIKKKYPEGVWKRVLRVRFIILEPFEDGRKDRALNNTVGYWRFETKGEKTSLRILRDAFDAAKDSARGKVAGTVFLMSVKMAESNNPGPKKKYPVVEIAPQYKDKQMEYICENIDVKQLEAPPHENNT